MKYLLDLLKTACGVVEIAEREGCPSDLVRGNGDL